MLNEVKETIDLINKSKRYINLDIFKSICNKCEVNYRQHTKNFFEGGLNSILDLPENLLNEIIEFTKSQSNSSDENRKWVKLFDSYDDYFKFLIVVSKKGGETLTSEISMSKVSDLQKVMNLYEQMIDDGDKFLLLRHLDSIPDNRENGNEKRIDIYDGDIIMTWDKYRSDSNTYIAKLKDGYVNERPYYKELLWSDKYGYLNPHGKPNEDLGRLIFEEGSLNTDEKFYNDYCIQLKSHWSKIGNIYYDTSCLKVKPI